MDLKQLQFNSEIQGLRGLKQPQDNLKTPVDKNEFADLLKKTHEEGLNKGQEAVLKFSAHAIDRMKTRGVKYDSEMLSRIENAVEKAKGKGAKDTLVIADDSALIVNHKKNTVVTVMDKMNLKENVFTNIDSTVIV